MFLDLLKYFFKYGALAVHRQRLRAGCDNVAIKKHNEAIVVTCEGAEWRSSQKRHDGQGDDEASVEWDVRLPSYRLTHALFLVEAGLWNSLSMLAAGRSSPCVSINHSMRWSGTQITDHNDDDTNGKKGGESTDNDDGLLEWLGGLMGYYPIPPE